MTNLIKTACIFGTNDCLEYYIYLILQISIDKKRSDFVFKDILYK